METEARMKKTGIRHTIVFQGSARINEESEQFKKNGYDRYYTEAYELSKQMTEWSEKNFSERKNKFYISSGGGPGIMEAANKGANKNKGKSVGLCIKLPLEEINNKFIDKDKELNFDYFFVRKVMFVKYAQGFVVMPGGFGTLDEVFEAITLIQTNKAEKFPIILVCSEFWEGMLDWIKKILLKENKNISSKDLDLIKIADTKEDVLNILEEFHNNYAFSPNF